METQLQTLKKQCKRLKVACGILALTMFVTGIHAFVQLAVAEAFQRQANEAMTRTMACEKETMRLHQLLEQALNETKLAQEFALEQSRKSSRGN